MKFLIIDTYYPAFLNTFRKEHPNLDKLSFLQQRAALIDACFGTSDYYSYNLKNLGHDAQDLIVNDEILQRQWSKEHSIKVVGTGLVAKIQSLPLIHRLIGRPSWMQQIALAQIRHYKPDVLYIQDLSALNPATLKAAKKYCSLVVGQIAYAMPAQENILAFDLILTSFPHFVSRFRKMGVKSEYFKIAFDPRVLKRLGKQKSVYDVSFVGSFSPHHSAGTKLLESLARATPINIWGHGTHFLSPSSPLRKQYHGQAWGRDMYQILAQSRIVVNRHNNVSENYANNMRLYESTGMGAMLITDSKKNLGDLFELNKEVVSYKAARDLIEKINYYLVHESKRKAIARAGQQRTLREHSYAKRMKELIKIINYYIK